RRPSGRILFDALQQNAGALGGLNYAYRMPDTVTTLLIGAAGGVVTAAIQYGARRYSETEQVRREVAERHLLQLQNSVESLYYRANNLRDWAGKSVMPDQYYQQSSAYIIARVL